MPESGRAGLGLWVHHFGLLFATRTKMDRFFDKKPKKSFRPSQRPISLAGIPTGVALGPVGFLAELDPNPRGEHACSRRDLEAYRSDSTMTIDENDTGGSRIVYNDTGGRSEGLLAPGTSTAGTVVGHDKHGDRPIGERLRPPVVVTDAHGDPVMFSHRKRVLAALKSEGSQQRRRGVCVGTSAAIAFF